MRYILALFLFGLLSCMVPTTNKRTFANPQAVKLNDSALKWMGGRPLGAIGLLKQAIKIDSNYSTAYYNLTLNLNLIGNYQEALKYVTRLVKLQPKNFFYHSMLGGEYDLIGDSIHALHEYKLSLSLQSKIIEKLDPNDKLYNGQMFMKGNLLINMGMDKEGQEIIRKIYSSRYFNGVNWH